MIVTGFNPSVTSLEKTYISRNYAIGTLSFLTRNSNRVAANDRILIGEPGNENSEILTVQSVSSDGLTFVTTAGSLYPHSASDAVYVLRYDQIKFYRSTTTADGSYTILSGGTVAVDVDNENLQTLFDDLTGLSSYFYKISFYHSVKNVESSLSDPIPGSGYARKQVGTLVQEFLNEVGDIEQAYITVPQIFGLLNECNEDIIGQSRRPYRFLRKKVAFALTASDNSINLATLAPDLIRFDRMKYQRTDVALNQVQGNVTMISTEEFEYRQYNQSALIPAPLGVGIQYATIDETDNKIYVAPKPTTTQAAAGFIYYWGDFDYINSMAQTFQTPVKRIYKLFLLSRYYRMRAKKESSFLNLADRYNNEYSTEIVKMQRAQKVDVGSKRSMLPDVRTNHGLRRSI